MKHLKNIINIQTLHSLVILRNNYGLVKKETKQSIMIVFKCFMKIPVTEVMFAVVGVVIAVVGTGGSGVGITTEK